MANSKQIALGPFRLDLVNECLWRGGDAIALRPKAYAVLKHLLDRRGELVTKQQLLEAVWPGTYVGDAVLKTTIRQLREAFDDDAESPRYIQTAHRRGYRFVAQIDDIDSAPQARAPSSDAAADDIRAGRPTPSGAPEMLGRETELAKLRALLHRALNAERQIVFVTGEAGLGKTTLVSALLDHAATTRGMQTARGQCLEQYGAGEAYLPFLEALSRLGRGPDGERVIACLRRFAPTWLLELRSLVGSDALPSAVSGGAGSVSRERMLREMAEALEALAADAPLIVALEDLHWSDYSTLDLIAYLARRRDPARLMVIGTYRPVEVILGDHPLKGVKGELQAHGLCTEMPLEYLREEAVADYLGLKLRGHGLEKRVARLIHKRTEGNPLFMVNLVDYLIDEHAIVNVDGEWLLRDAFAAIEAGVPDNIRQLIEKHIERLSPDERSVLEGASVVGMECSSAAIAAGLAQPAEWVEERCEALVERHRFLSPARLVELPDGTITPRYRFSHVLYREVPYRRLPPMRRMQIHRRVGASGEAIYQDRAAEIAGELAMHFEQGGDQRRAAKYLLLAAENARNRSAQHAAEALARRGLLAVAALPPSRERDQWELGLRVILGTAVLAVKGVAAAEVKDIVDPAFELARRHGASLEAFMARWVLGFSYYFRGDLELCREEVARLFEQAEEVRDPLMIIEAHRASGITLVELGRCREALTALDEAVALYDAPDRQRGRVSFGVWHPKVSSDCYAARALWMLGYADQAMTRLERGLSLAREFGHAETMIVALHFAAHLHQLRGEAAASQERAEAVIAVAEEYGLTMWIALGRINRGWARIEQGHAGEGVEELREGLVAYESTGAKLSNLYFAGLLARGLVRVGQIHEAHTLVTQALGSITDNGESWFAAELFRIQAEVLIAQAVAGPARHAVATAALVENSLQKALVIAHRQQSKAWELRVLTTRGSSNPGDQRGLAAALDWFEEGQETADLREARAVLSAS